MTCKVDCTCTYITQLKLQKIRYYYATHRQKVNVVQCNITFFYFYSFSCVIYVQSTLHVVVNFLVFVFYICCSVIVNMPVIYVYCFASVMGNKSTKCSGNK